MLCALGTLGDLACTGWKEMFSAVATPVNVPPVRAVAIGARSLRVLTVDGEVYDFAAVLTPPPLRACPKDSPRPGPHKLRLDGPAMAITTGSCVLMRSGRTVCAEPLGE